MAEADPIASLSPTGERYFNRELSWLAFNQRVLEAVSYTHLTLPTILRV